MHRFRDTFIAEDFVQSILEALKKSALITSLAVNKYDAKYLYEAYAPFIWFFQPSAGPHRCALR